MVEQITELYVDIIPYSEFKHFLKEEILGSDDIIKQGDDYKNAVETRFSINKHLSGLAKRIRELPYVKSCNPDPSSKFIKRGLSCYLEVKFNHPDGLTKEEIDKHYRYTIRFSDHFDKHDDKRTHRTDLIDVIGRKVKNLEKVGMKQFRNSLSDIQADIAEFEEDKFGEQVTFFEE